MDTSNVGMADGDEGGSDGSPLPTPAQLDADIQAAQQAAVKLEEEHQQTHEGKMHSQSCTIQASSRCITSNRSLPCPRCNH